MKSAIFFIAKVLDSLTWLVLAGMMFMTVIDVLLRKFTNYSIMGSVELTELMMVLIVFCSLAQCEANDGHIRVDVVFKHFNFSPRKQAWTDAITQFLCFGLFSLMSWAIYRHAVNIKAWGEVTLDLRLPLYPFVYIASVGCGLLALVLLLKALLALGEIVTR